MLSSTRGQNPEGMSAAGEKEDNISDAAATRHRKGGRDFTMVFSWDVVVNFYERY
jgi:hypothetical protein